MEVSQDECVIIDSGVSYTDKERWGLSRHRCKGEEDEVEVVPKLRL